MRRTTTLYNKQNHNKQRRGRLCTRVGRLRCRTISQQTQLLKTQACACSKKHLEASLYEASSPVFYKLTHLQAKFLDPSLTLGPFLKIVLILLKVKLRIV